jgi:hypothetical protein
MKINLKRLALATASVGMLTIYGCGGGGGSTPVVDPTNSTKVTPSLGQFSLGTVVKLTKRDGTVLSTGTIGANGSVTLAYLQSYTDPIVVTVEGAADVTYFDEGTSNNESFPAGSKLRAVLPAPQAQAGVSALTDAAVANLEAAGGLAQATADTVKQSNNKIAAVFGLTDILLAPTPVNKDTGAKLDHTSLNDQYALVLAAFAKDAKTKGITLKTFTKTFADDLEDGKLDGKQNTKALTNSMTADSMKVAYLVALKAHATPNSASVAEATPMVITADVTAVKAVSNQSDVQLAKNMFADLRTTARSLTNDKNTGFLNTKPQSFQDDMNANVAPELNRVFSRTSTLSTAINMYEEAKALTANSTKGFTVGTDPIDNSKSALIRSNGSLESAWYGYANYSYCWTDSSTPANITKVSCAAAGQDSADYATNTLKLVKFVLTPGSASNAYAYTAQRFNKSVTFTQTTPWLTFGPSISPTDIPIGSGTLSKALSGSTVTNLTIKGTMPPSTASTGVDNIDISVARSALSGGNFRYALNGSVSAAQKADSTKVTTLSFDSGSYFDLNESITDVRSPVGVKIIGTAKTAASKFTGTLEFGNFKKDIKGASETPTLMIFTGAFSDLSAAGAGEFLTGKLQATLIDFNLYDVNAPETANNLMKATLEFTGTVQAPDRPLLKLVLAGTKTGLTTASMTLDYSYGSGINIKGNGIVDSADTSKNTMTLSNQAGIQFIVKQNTPTVVTKAGVKLATIENNRINYIDGVSESF